MQKLPFKPISLATFISLAVVACGSSGGGSTKSTTANVTKPITEIAIPDKTDQQKNTSLTTSPTTTPTTTPNNSDDTQLNELKTRLDAIEKQLGSLSTSTGNTETLTSITDKLTTIGNQLNSISTNSLKNNTEMQALLSELKAQKTYLEEEQKKLKDQLTELKQQKEKLIQQRNELSQLADNKEKLIQEKEQALIEKENVIREKENILTAHIEASNDKDRQISELYSRINDLENQLWNKDSQIQNTLNEVTTLTEQLNNLTKQINPYQETTEQRELRLTREKERENFVAPKFVQYIDQANPSINSDYNFDVNITADGIRHEKNIISALSSSNVVYVSYNYNLEEAGNSILIQKDFSNGQEKIVYSFGGNPTRAQYLSELQRFQGSAEYSGKVYTAQNVLTSSTGTYDRDITINLTANFTNKSISGTVDDHRPYATIITLNPTIINSDRGRLEFSGTASRTIIAPYMGPPETFKSAGSYQGVFMGARAEQISGYLNLPASYTGASATPAVFTAEKQP
ncbi:hypothetical protein QV09_01035 [Gallibacterium salpingitidis]|uniref:Transferrin-binding protein B C-lobe/N-lobe beta-barrel domain-containing protein n=1 Tax=Gallibacterium salpingitidis TaxID=505341 RepID=A0AB36E4M9_9PAST|nr:transferrin-binding protein-like solute binding protein [Gallibacterium salpingitidis]OBX11869.1 hypothetical protein QV09_01035 [Gallibacterium salpingitidis]